MASIWWSLVMTRGNAQWATVIYVAMQCIPIAAVLMSGKRWFAVATALWAAGNIIAYLSK